MRPIVVRGRQGRSHASAVTVQRQACTGSEQVTAHGPVAEPPERLADPGRRTLRESRPADDLDRLELDVVARRIGRDGRRRLGRGRRVGVEPVPGARQKPCLWFLAHLGPRSPVPGQKEDAEDRDVGLAVQEGGDSDHAGNDQRGDRRRCLAAARGPEHRRCDVPAIERQDGKQVEQAPRDVDVQEVGHDLIELRRSRWRHPADERGDRHHRHPNEKTRDRTRQRNDDGSRRRDTFAVGQATEAPEADPWLDPEPAIRRGMTELMEQDRYTGQHDPLDRGEQRAAPGEPEETEDEDEGGLDPDRDPCEAKRRPGPAQGSSDTR